MSRISIKLAYRDNIGVLWIDWRCSYCDRIMSLPSEQGINYCFHCGSQIKNWEEQYYSLNKIKKLPYKPYERLL